MYLDHFGLATNPFGLSPKLEFLYQSGAFEESMAHLIYGVDNSEAIIMITGVIGTGKTMALQSFMANLNRNFQWALVTNTQVTPVELLKLILEDLGVDFPLGCDKSDLLILFKEFLIRTSRSGQRVIIIIDEAQNMTREVLEEVRLLTNLGQGDIQPVQVILVGQPELETVVNRADLAQLRQRIRVHYRLEPLSRKEVEEYLDHRMAVAGCKRKVFKPGAVDRIARLSGGVPRLVNSLAGQALLAAYVAGRDRVLEKDVEPPDGIAPAPPVGAGPAPAPPPEPPREPVASPPAAAEPARGHAIRRKRNRRSNRPLVAALVVVILVMVALSMYIRGDLQPLAERFLAAPAAPTIVQPGHTAAAETMQQQVAAAPAETPPDLSEAASGTLMVVEAAADTLEKNADGYTVSEAVDNPAVSGTGAEQPAAEQETQAVSGPKYFAHVASFKTLERAQNYVNELHAAGFETLVKSHRVTGQIWQRVFIGPYDDRMATKEAVARLKGSQDKNYYHIVVMSPDDNS